MRRASRSVETAPVVLVSKAGVLPWDVAVVEEE
jgi:hypothetical protein